jgi:hypothetical protein
MNTLFKPTTEDCVAGQRSFREEMKNKKTTLTIGIYSLGKDSRDGFEPDI